MAERRRSERRAAPQPRTRRQGTPEERQAAERLERLLDTTRGRRRGIQIPGHFGNGTLSVARRATDQ